MGIPGSPQPKKLGEFYLLFKTGCIFVDSVRIEEFTEL